MMGWNQQHQMYDWADKIERPGDFDMFMEKDLQGG
jgi:hypothetical protein